MRSISPIIISLIVPVFNEQDTVSVFLDRIGKVFDGDESVRLELVFVNDGSTDNTLQHLLLHQRSNCCIRVIDLSRHFGKEAALSAGLQAAKGHVVVPIDADLQDPPELIGEMIAHWREGYDVVLAQRINRNTDSWPKRISAKWFYRIHNWMADPKIPDNVGDFRLMDRSVVDVLNTLPESRRFMKGLFAWVGFNTTFLKYDRPQRAKGASKFTSWRLWNFAIEGLTSFSLAPLRLWSYLGAIVALVSFLYGLIVILRVLIYGIDVPGYASLLAAIIFLGGLQLIGIGVVGEYLGRTYLESKRRPPYVVRQVYEPSSFGEGAHDGNNNNKEGGHQAAPKVQ